MEDNRNYCTKETMKIDDKIVFKDATSNDKLLREPAKRKKKSLLMVSATCFSDFLSTKLQDTESRKIVIIKSRMTPGILTMGNRIEFTINYLF